MHGVKTKKELRQLRHAAKITKSIYKDISKKVKPGRSELEIAGDIEENIRKKGFKRSFKTIVASGANTAMPHAKPTARRIKKNDAVMIDFGIVFNGYCSDLTRMITIGRQDPLRSKLYSAVLDAQDFAIKTLRPGIKISGFVAGVHNRMRKKGLGKYIMHSLGHGVGKRIHEAPKLSEKNMGTFKAGMVVTIEPGLYKKGSGGARKEDMIEITKSGARVLTK